MAVSDSKQISNNNLVVIMLLITFLVVGATAIVGKILIGNIVLDTKVVTAKQKADKQLDVDIANAPNLVKSFKALGPQAGKLADALPNEPDFPALIVELENMANAAGVNLKGVTPAAMVPTGTVSPTSVTGTATTGGAASASTLTMPQQYHFAVELDGTYDSIMRLMTLIETSARPMHVDTIQLSGKGPALSSNLNLTTYYQNKASLPFSTETVK